TPLMRAVAAGADAAAVEALLSGKANVRAQDDQNRCAHSLAAENSAVPPEVLERLIDAGADLDTPSNGLETPLMVACRADNLPAVRVLLRRGADIGLRDQRLWTPLFFAAASGASADLIRLLAASGASIDETASQGTTPLMAALESPKGAAALKPLLELGTDPNLRNMATVTPLMMATANDDLESVALLLSFGADPTQGTWDGLTPLMVAARRSRRAELLEALASSGAPVDQPSGLGMTALMVAAASGNVEGIRSLLALSADVKLKDADGMTALTHSVLARDWNAQAAELLIEGGADIEARTLKDTTPLMEAAYHGNAPAARLLLDAGARADAQDRIGWTPLHFAAKNERGLDVLTILIAATAETTDQPDMGGTSPLMVAAASNNPKAVTALLKAGADPRRTDDTGRNSLDYARLKNAAECVSLLEKWENEGSLKEMVPPVSP
ncbi:MAG: ankyrin repeat domain-containing protein, partial [Fretibacterium sp.]